MADLAASKRSRKRETNEQCRSSSERKRPIGEPKVANRRKRQWCIGGGKGRGKRQQKARLIELCNGAEVTDWLVPECVWQSSSKLSAALMEGLERLVRCRGALDRDHAEGQVVLLTAQPALLERRPRRRDSKNFPLPLERLISAMEKAAKSPYPGRRLDRMGAFCRVMAVSVHFASYETGAILDGQKQKRPLSVEEIAWFARVPVRTVTDCLEMLRAAKWLPFTKHFTAEDLRGGVYTTQPSLRLLDWDRITACFGEGVRKLFEFARVCESQKTKAEREALAAKAAEKAALERKARLAEKQREAARHRLAREVAKAQEVLERATKATLRNGDLYLAPPPSGSLGASLDDLSPNDRLALYDEIAASDPSRAWGLDELHAEALRRLEPPTPGPSESETSDEP